MNIEKANNAIKSAWIAGVISGTLTLILSLIGAFGFDLWNLIDAFLTFGLTFGIYKKNRACAIILFIYFVGDKIFALIQSPATAATGIPMALVFGYFFFQGIRGTFAYHRIRKSKNEVI